MAISVSQAKGIFTKVYLEAYKERTPVDTFLKSFFTVTTNSAKSIGIEVQRGTERIAVDVLRENGGNRNTFSKSSDKEYVPPFYSEYFDVTALARYDRIFGANPDFTPETIGYLGNEVADKYMVLREKIERAKEKQAAQVLETGIVVLNNGDNIDFKRKAASIVDVSGSAPWTTAASDIETQFINAATFLRNVGKNNSPVITAIMSSTAWVNLKKSNFFTNNANFNQVKLIDIKKPQRNSVGAAYQGQISAGAYLFDIWTYDGIYEDSTGTVQNYLDSKKVIFLPNQGTKLVMAHAGVPAIMRDKAKAEFSEYIAQLAKEYYMNNYIDPKAKAHFFELISAPLAIPVTIDQIYTLKVIV